MSEIAKEQPTPQAVHVDTFAAGAGGKSKREEEDEMPDELSKADWETRHGDVDLYKEELTGQARKDLPSSEFAIPDKREYPIHNKSHADNALARAAGKPEEGKVRAAVHRKYPELKKADVEVDAIKLWKSADAQHLVYGVVLQPGVRDSQGDVVSSAEIEKAAHSYLVEHRKSDVQHDEQQAGASLVESSIAPHDMVFAGQPVLKGSWVTVYKIHDPELWARIANPDHAKPLTGLSMGGSAFRLPDGSAA